MKNDITSIDKNFKVETSIEKDDIKFFDAEESPFKIYGIFREGDRFRRMPESVAKSVSEGVYHLHGHNAGGRIKFVTDSKYIAINVKYPEGALGKMPHFALTGSIGFDMYIKEDGIQKYTKSFVPPFDITESYESLCEFADKKTREVTIHFPLYSSVSKLYIGLEENAALAEAPNYKIETPIVYYGSSITQGGCASRPGSAYQNIISRRLDVNHINLGFSGSARGEDEMTDYIKNLDMKIFVMDYDHNAPTVQHLEKTHERMFKSIREVNPDLPVIFMPKPKQYLTDEDKKRKEIILRTYENALNSGDKNVYFISNEDLTSYCKDEGTVDGCHPTDYGFYNMADALIPVIKKILNI